MLSERWVCSSGNLSFAMADVEGAGNMSMFEQCIL